MNWKVIIEYHFKIQQFKIQILRLLKYEFIDQLAAEYEQKAKEHEVKQFIKAKERQAIFEEAFETEIQQYKESGVIPSIT